MTNRILVGAVFLVGCAVGGASSQLVVPKASAQQAAQLTKWEYQCWFGGSDVPIANAANKFGSESWEMVGLTHISNSPSFQVCYKRPKL